MRWWGDPGPCPVDDAPHTTCTSADYDGGIVIVQLPARDASAAAPPLRADTIQATLPKGQFTTGTYRGARPTPPRKR
jgi:hypothetical protein